MLLDLLKQKFLHLFSVLLVFRPADSSESHQIAVEHSLLTAGQSVVIFKIQQNLPRKKLVIILRQRINKILIEIGDLGIQLHAFFVPAKSFLVCPMPADVDRTHSSHGLLAGFLLITSLQQTHSQRRPALQPYSLPCRQQRDLRSQKPMF